MTFRFGRLSPSEIHTSDTSFQITTREDTEDLWPSVRTLGVINPPLIWRDARDRWVVVCGRRRLAALSRMGNDVPLEVRLSDSDVSRLDCIKLSISDNAFQRPLNWVEISRGLNLLMGELKDKNQVLELLPDLGLPRGKDVLDKALGFARYAKPIQDGLVSGSLAFTMALELGKLDPETGGFFADLFQRLGLGLNKQREVLEWALEIATRESCSPSDIFREEAVQALLNDPDEDRNQKASHLRNCLKKRRYPSIQKAETRFRSQLKSLKIPQGIKLVPPWDFESDRYTVEMEFKDLEQLAVRIDILEGLAGSETLKDMLRGWDADSNDNIDASPPGSSASGPLASK